MAGPAAIALFVLVAEDDDLIALHLAQNLGHNFSTAHEWRADEGLIAANQQHFAKLDLAADLGIEQCNIDFLTFFDAVLHPAIPDNCVHDAAPQKYRGSG